MKRIMSMGLSFSARVLMPLGSRTSKNLSFFSLQRVGGCLFNSVQAATDCFLIFVRQSDRAAAKTSEPAKVPARRLLQLSLYYIIYMLSLVGFRSL